MRQELIEKILMVLSNQSINLQEIESHLYIILNDYEISNRETSIAIRDEDKNLAWLQKFLIAKTVKGCSERTLEYYRKQIWMILQKINKPANEITSDDIRYYLAIRERRDGITKITASNELRCLRTFFAFLAGEEICLKNPTLKIETMKCPKKKKEAFTEIEVEKIRAACKNNREKAIVEILLSTGCRVSELVNIQIDEMDQDKVLIHGKGNKDRIVYLNAKAQIVIAQYMNERKDNNPYLFPKGKPIAECQDMRVKKGDWYKYSENMEKDEHTDKSSIEGIIRKIGKRCGVKGAHPHKFRRTCATFALRRGMPIEQVSKMLGHEQIGTTQIYLDLDENELKQAHKKYVV